MELGTFGAIIGFALELELQAYKYYEDLNNRVSFPTVIKLMKGSQKRSNRLRRIRQELVTEMILEPITGVESDDYLFSISEESVESEYLNQGIRLEENMRHFYLTMAPLIPMKEVERAFLRLAKENVARIEILGNRAADI